MSEMKKNGKTRDTREETKHIIEEGKEGKGGERIAEKGIRGAQERICFKFHFFLEVSMPKDQLGQSTRFDRTPTCDRQTETGPWLVPRGKNDFSTVLKLFTKCRCSRQCVGRSPL